MLQIIGLIVVVYAVARLLQVPIEHRAQKSDTALWLISILAIVAIGILTLMLVASGASISSLPM